MVSPGFDSSMICRKDPIPESLLFSTKYTLCPNIVWDREIISKSKRPIIFILVKFDSCKIKQKWYSKPIEILKLLLIHRSGLFKILIIILIVRLFFNVVRFLYICNKILKDDNLHFCIKTKLI